MKFVCTKCHEISIPINHRAKWALGFSIVMLIIFIIVAFTGVEYWDNRIKTLVTGAIASVIVWAAINFTSSGPTDHRKLCPCCGSNECIPLDSQRAQELRSRY